MIFGEYIPLREELPFMASLTPLHGGPRPAVRHRGSARARRPSASARREPATGPGPPPWPPLICYEDTVPHLVRDTVNDLSEGPTGAPDILAVLSNDGWFAGSAEQEQHLAVSLFRAVETRHAGRAGGEHRGVSAVIDGDGVPREPAYFLDALGAEAEPNATPDDEAGVLIADVPLDPPRQRLPVGGRLAAGGLRAGGVPRVRAEPAAALAATGGERVVGRGGMLSPTGAAERSRAG